MKKILTPFAVSLLSFIALGLIVALVLPSEYTITRKLEIGAPVEKIFPLVADFSQWRQWSPWYESEPTAQYSVEGEMGKIGSKIVWKGRIVGQGTMTLVDVKRPVST